MKRNVVTLISVLILAFLLTGCAAMTDKESVDTPQSVSLVLGINENFPKINFNSEVISDAVWDAAYSYGSVNAIIADGEPFAGSDFNITKPTKNIDSDKCRQLANDNTEQMLAQMSTLSPKTSETDLLSAIDLSADWLHSTEEGSELHMDIIASGLVTTGLLDMTTQNIVDEPVESLIKQLKEIHALPDLTGIYVTWIGFGQVSGDQAKITGNYEYKLQERWEAILTEAGAASVKFDKSPLSDETYAEELPSCSIVPIVEDSVSFGKITDESMPLRYNKDKRKKPLFSRGFGVCRC